MYLRCGEQYRQRYIDGKILPPGISLIKGKTAHSGVEFNFRQKIESKIDLPKNDIIDFTVSEYDKATDEIFLSDEEKTIGKNKIVGQGKDDIVSVMGLYSDSVAPNIQPVAVEFKHTVEIPDCRPLVTIIDCLDDKNIVRDVKFTGKSKTQSEADNSIQLTIYALSHNDRLGIMPDSLVLDTLVTSKTPKYQEIKTTRTEQDFISAIRVIQAVQNGIAAGVFLPAAEGSWMCSPKFCGYYQECKFKNKSYF
jgi:putative RecB family exonuclease